MRSLARNALEHLDEVRLAIGLRLFEQSLKVVTHGVAADPEQYRHAFKRMSVEESLSNLDFARAEIEKMRMRGQMLGSAV